MQVLRTQKVSLSFGTGDTSLNGTLAGFTTLAQCAPLSVSVQCGTDTAQIAQVDFDVDLTSTTNVTVSRGVSGVACTVIVYVVEFDDNTTIQKSTWTIAAAGTSTTASITASVMAESFTVFYRKCTTASTLQPNASNISCELTTTTNVAIAKAIAGGDHSGHVYTIHNSDMSVQRGSTTSTTQPNNTTISAVVLANSFCICSHTSTETRYEDEGNGHLRISSTTQLEWNVGYSSGDDVYKWQVVSDPEFNVQRFHSRNTSTASANFTLTAIDVNFAVAMPGAMPGRYSSALYDNAGDMNNRCTSYSITSSTSCTWSKSSGSGSYAVDIVEFTELVATDVTITDVDSDESVYIGQTGVIITGTNFGTDGANSRVRLNSASNGSGTDVVQTDTSWSDTSVQFTVGLGALSLGTVYAFVRNQSLVENAAGFAISIYGIPSITNFGDEDHTFTETSVAVTGEYFESSQGTGKVEIGDAATYAGSGTKVTQSIGSWADGALTIDMVQGAHTAGTKYLYVTNNSGGINSAGYSFSFVSPYVKPTVSTVSSPNVLEGNNLIHTVTLSHATEAIETYTYSFVDVTTGGTDYSSRSFSNSVSETGGTVSVPNGVISYTVTFLAVSDLVEDGSANETYTLTIGGVVSTGTIRDLEAAATYDSTVLALAPNHLWTFDGDYADSIGSATGTASVAPVTGTALCETVSNSMYPGGRAARVTIPSTTDINNSAQARKCVAGWFMVDAIQLPPCRVYGEGNNTQSFAFIIGNGNFVIFEVDSADFTVQCYSDTPLVPNRVYHLCLIFEGSGYGNELRAYLDGVKQTTALPADRQPNSATLAARTPVEFADPAGTVSIGGTTIVLVAPITGHYNYWATWDGAPAVLSDTQVRDDLFEKGALPHVTIASGTLAVMQAALDALADTVRGNYPLCIRVEGVTGGGDFSLTADNITFDPLASIHVQYVGANEFTWRNSNGAKATILSSTGTGTMTTVDVVSVQLQVLDITDNSTIAGARVLLKAGAGGNLVEGTTLINGTTDGSGNISLSFDYTSDQPVIGRARKAGTTPLFKTGLISDVVLSTGLTKTILLIPDE